ncbi:ABC transporter permease [Chryseolinea sp. T2]|uniref:ABC transporter permease n=1 Tax=Chryseolinea sp. T2 TaxID=3129255 RepID=UPI003078015A
MIRNYLVVALRNITRQFSYSAINILGLAIGLACSAVIFMYVMGEWSYDRHNPKADRIYKVGIAFFGMGGFGIGPEVLGESLPAQFEGVEAFTRIRRDGSLIITTEYREFRELAYYTDASFFKLFPRDFVEGSPSTALKNDNSIVITESVAQKFFGTADALGRSISIGKEKKPFAVTGVVKDDNHKSQLNSKIWLSIHGILTHETNYTSAGMYNYVLLKDGQTQNDLELALDRILEKEIFPGHMGVPEGLSFDEYKKHPNAVQFPVYALKDVHLKSKLRYEISAGGDEDNLYAFGAISLFVLLLAAVNFINLTTARASRRAREVGIRKAVGSSRFSLMSQFLSESMIVAAIAMVFALFFGEAFLLIFQLMAGSPLVDSLWTPWNLAILFSFAVLIGLCSGIYPAFYLTSFQPARVLKGHTNPSGGSGFRNILVVSQFVISLCLMMCTTVIFQQMNYMKNRDLGFHGENIFTIDDLGELGTQVEVFRTFVSGLQGVSGVGRHSGEPGNESVKTVYNYQTETMTEGVTLNTYPMDAEMIPLMQYQLIAGRNFNRDLVSDTSAIILNEAAVKFLGLKEPVGAKLKYGGTVIGVVKDYHWQSLRETIAPSVFAMGRNNYPQLSVRVSNATASSVLGQINNKWKELVPDEPFNYHFVDENFGNILEKEKLFGRAVGFFTVLAIFVSCLGLYGLSAYTTEQRNKEIGIRKVMGASSANIVLMLNRRFAILVAMAVLIATPLALYLMSQWREGFAYRADMSVVLFAGAIVAAFGVALATVSYHSVKASLSNPVKALKYE